MFLTREEFERIRPLQWSLKNYGNKVYHTIIGRSEVQLFWLDFMRLIFAPKYRNQYGVLNIEHFDQTQPVLLSDDLELILPNDIDLAMYYANNTTLPMHFSVHMPQMVVFIMSLILFVVLIAFQWRMKRKNEISHNFLI